MWLSHNVWQLRKAPIVHARPSQCDVQSLVLRLAHGGMKLQFSVSPLLSPAHQSRSTRARAPTSRRFSKGFCASRKPQLFRARSGQQSRHVNTLSAWTAPRTPRSSGLTALAGPAPSTPGAPAQMASSGHWNLSECHLLRKTSSNQPV